MASVSEHTFYDVFNNLQKFQRKEPSPIKTNSNLVLFTTDLGSKADVQIDFFLDPSHNSDPNNSRIQFDVFRQKVYRQSKLNKEFVDIIHNGMEYRISVAFEDKQEMDKKEFCNLKTKGINKIRIKNRRSWQFEFKSVDLTTTFEIDKHSRAVEGLLKIIQQYTQPSKFW